MSEARWLSWLPFGLLALGTLVATFAAPEFDGGVADVRLTLALSAVTATWMALTPHPGAVNWVGRSLLAFVLCWMNPFYAVFSIVGFVDVFESLRGRWVYAGIMAVAVTQAGSQMGGFPPQDPAEGAVFAALLLLNGGLATVFMRFSQRTEQRNDDLERLNADLECVIAENAALHEQLVARAREHGMQEERARLAREIHDTIAQSLAGIVTQLEAADGGERSERALALAREALAEARRSVLDLAPRPLDGSTLSAALDSVVGSWAADRTVRTDLVVTGDPEPLHPEVEATMLRIAQESLTNIAKHADAERVGVTLSYDGDEVVLDVRDDGIGFDTDLATAESAFGLRGMRQRAERLAGALTLESRPGSGTAVSVRLPALARERA